MAAGVAAAAPSALWQTMDGAALGARSATRRSTTRTPTTTPRRRRSRRRAAWTRSIPSCCAPTRSSASRCASSETPAGRRRRRRGVRQRLGRHHLQGAARRRSGVIFCSISEAVREHPELVRKYLGSGRAACRQLLRRAELGRVHRRLVRLHPQGRALPDGAVDLFPHQCAQHRPVRAHADHRRRGQPTSATSKAAPRRSATRTSCTPRWSSWSRSTTPRSSTRTVQNWYPGDAEGKGGIYNFVTKRGACRGAQLQGQLDPGRDRLGDHLEIPELHPAGRRFASASSTRSRSPTTASRPIPAPR